MALVAYENSDSSEYEDDNNENNFQQLKKEAADAGLMEQNGEHESAMNPSLFIQLPQPSSKKKVVLEEDDEFLHKKEKQADAKPKSKISIPSLSDFKDVDVTIPSSKTKAVNGKKSGLLSILPQPRNSFMSTTRSLIPNVIKQKPQTNTAKKKAPIPSKIPDTKALITEYSDDSDNEEIQNDFFSINKPVEVPTDMPLPEDKPIDEEEPVKTIKKPRSLESYFKKEIDNVSNIRITEIEKEIKTDNELSVTAEYLNIPNEENVSVEYTPQVSEGMDNIIESSNQVELNDDVIMKLCGTRAKRKREEIQIVDINQAEVLSEAREMLLKGLMDDTSKRQSFSKKRGNEPTSQQKRKHQITYLAHQAKANEAELQNQWANNRMTKRQTQSKYGF